MPSDFPPDLPDGWRDAIRRLRLVQAQIPPAYFEAAALAGDRMREIQRQWAASIGPALETLSRNWATQWAPALEAVRGAWKRVMPANWSELSTDEVMAVIDRVRTTGVCLVWVPRESILRDVLAADASATTSVLVENSGDVLDDVVACLDAIEGTELGDESNATRQAINAFRDGHPEAAQALASSAFTSAAHVAFATSRTRKIRAEMAEEDPAEAGFSQIRIRTIYAAGASAFDGFRPDTASPRHFRFNRHNTAHRITREQFTHGNALTAIMLCAGLMRELDYWYRRAAAQHDPDSDHPT